MRRHVVIAVLTFCSMILLVLSCGPSQSSSGPGIEGVWTLAEQESLGRDPSPQPFTPPSLLIFSGTHYSMMYVDSDLGKSPWDEERAAVYPGLVANSGTYALDGSTLTRHVTLTIATMRPVTEPGAPWTYTREVQIDGESLWITGTSSTGTTTRYKWVRVSASPDG